MLRLLGVEHWVAVHPRQHLSANPLKLLPAQLEPINVSSARWARRHSGKVAFQVPFARCKCARLTRLANAQRG